MIDRHLNEWLDNRIVGWESLEGYPHGTKMEALEGQIEAAVTALTAAKTLLEGYEKRTAVHMCVEHALSSLDLISLLLEQNDDE